MWVWESAVQLTNTDDSITSTPRTIVFYPLNCCHRTWRMFIIFMCYRNLHFKIWVCPCSCVYAHVRAFVVRPEVDAGCLPLACSTLVIEKACLFLNIELTDRLEWETSEPRIFWNLPPSIETSRAGLDFPVSAGRQSTYPHICMASSLPTEPSP